MGRNRLRSRFRTLFGLKGFKDVWSECVGGSYIYHILNVMDIFGTGVRVHVYV